MNRLRECAPKLLLAALLLLLACGCRPVQPPVLPPPSREPEIFPNLRVFVYDDKTGELLTGASVTADRDDGKEVAVAEDDGWYAETCPPGVYAITVEHAGYDALTVSGIQLLAGRFWEQDLVPVDVIVRLTPSTVTKKPEVRP